MHNSVSEQSFSNEGDEEEDEEKEFNKGEDNGNDSDSSNYSNNNRQQSKPIYLNTTRPQICRQSIDLYCSVPSPSITSLGTSKLSRLSSSFPSLSLTRRHTHEIFPSATQPLLPTAEDEQKPHHRQSSVSLLHPTPSRRGSRRKSSVVTHGLPVSGRSSFGQAVVNGMNVLCGVGILSTPYAVKQGGWAGLSVLAIFAVLSFYTGLLLCRCLDSQPGLETYPDIGQAAFGTLGRLAISIILYAELYACCVEYIILESDNLSSLFPNARLNFGGFVMNSHHLFALLATIAILPTVWLRDLTMLSYISVGGVIASILAVLCLFWVGLVDKVGFQTKGAMLNLKTLPVAIGLYGYCYSGHAVFPNIYASMQKKSQFPAVLLICFGVCTLMYAGVAVMGYLMFGESALSQFSLNLPQDLVAAKIAVWTTVVNPFTKYPSSRNEQFVSRSDVPGGIDAIKHSQISSVRDPHQNCIGDFYLGCGPHRPFLRSGYGTDWIFTYNANNLDTSLCMLPEHLEGQNNSFSGIGLYIDYCCRCCISSLWNIFSPLYNCREFEIIIKLTYYWREKLIPLEDFYVNCKLLQLLSPGLYY